MNANALALGAVRSGSGPLSGFDNFVRKETWEWLRSRRFVAMAVAATLLALSGALIERFRQIAGDTTGKPINLDPSYNLTMVGWDSLVPLFAAFGTMALITAEREKGTLAWSLSMPLGRPAVFLSKLFVGIAFVGVTAVLIPEIVSVGVVRLAYDGFPGRNELVWEPLGGLAFAAFVVALNMATSTYVRGQVAVLGTTLVTVLTIPTMVGLLSADLKRFMPTEIYTFVTAFGKGGDAHPETFVAWIVSIAALVAVGLIEFRRREL